MTSKNMAKCLIVDSIYGWFVVVISLILSKALKFIGNETLINVLILNILIPVSYCLFYKINKFFKIAAILRIIMSVFSITVSIINHNFNIQWIDFALLVIPTVLSIILELYFIKGIIDIFKGFKEEKLCQKWDFVLFAMMVYLIPKLILDVATNLNLQNDNAQLAIMVFNIIVVLLGAFAFTYEFVYKIKSIIFLWKAEK